MAPPEAIRLAVRRAFAGTAAGAARRQEGRRHLGRHPRTYRRGALHRQSFQRQDGEGGRRRGLPARRRVVLVTTQPADGAPYGVVRVESADDMAAAVREQVLDADVLVMAAAVADFKPCAEEVGKIRRGDRETLTLDLVRTVTSSPRRRGPACSASASPPSRAATAARPREEGGEGRRSARVQRHPRRGRRHRRRRERYHHHHGAPGRSRCRAPARAPRRRHRRPDRSGLAAMSAPSAREGRRDRGGASRE